MKTPPHLEGLIGALMATEEACEGTSFDWLLRKEKNGYFATIFLPGSAITFPYHAKTPAGALASALTEFNLRIKK